MAFKEANLITGHYSVYRGFNVCHSLRVFVDTHHIQNKATVVFSGSQGLILSVHPANLILSPGQETGGFDASVLYKTGYSPRIYHVQRSVFDDTKSVSHKVAVFLKVSELQALIYPGDKGSMIVGMVCQIE